MRKKTTHTHTCTGLLTCLHCVPYNTLTHTDVHKRSRDTQGRHCDHRAVVEPNKAHQWHPSGLISKATTHAHMRTHTYIHILVPMRTAHWRSIRLEQTALTVSLTACLPASVRLSAYLSLSLSVNVALQKTNKQHTH